jgi:sporulation-control protein spo0M
MGFGSTECKTTVYLKQNEYFSGETIQVRVECDNSKCDKAIKSFKLKLNRKYRGRGKNFKFDEVVSFVT